MTGATAAESHTFKTEIQELLHLIVHTLYTHPEIFLRELLSNANDALSKVQFESLTNAELYDKDQPLQVDLVCDKKLKMLTVKDTGVGMSRDELIQQIGTIAHSGTKKFLNGLKEAKDKQAAPELIGQFGVGFYSAFMVADYVTIDTKSMVRDEPAVRWESDGQGSYTIAPSDRRTRGTEITLKLKDEFTEFLEEERIKHLVNQYSNYLPFPVKLGDEQINQTEALWRKQRSDIKQEDYASFYQQLTGDYQEPLISEDIASEAPVQFRALIYVPKRAPMEFAGDEHDHGVKLYAKRVFIQDRCKALLPKFLRFLRGLVDSEDIPLNVSREMIQNDRQITKINHIITKKVIAALRKTGEKDPETYLEFWKQYGRFIKEGVHSEHSLREKLLPLLRYSSTQSSEDAEVTLAAYAERKVEGQNAIYYAVGDSVEQLRKSPHLEFFLEKNIEVLLATDPMDDLLLSQLEPYQDLKFINVESGDLDLPEKFREESATVNAEGPLKKLEEKVKATLQDHINQVRFSKQLKQYPCRFYNAQGGMSHSVKKMVFQVEGMAIPLKRDLELNPEHPFVASLSEQVESEGVEDRIKLLYHLANLLEGQVEEPQELASLIMPMLQGN